MKSKKLIIYLIITVSCAIAIFMLSSQDKTTSGTNSLSILTAIAEFLSKTFHINIGDDNIRRLHNLFRKMAHFSIYTILSIFAYNTFQVVISQKKYVVVATFAFCLLTAITDELHQIFVPGRSGEVRDVLIDTLGVCFGLVLVWLGNEIMQRIRKTK